MGSSWGRGRNGRRSQVLQREGGMGEEDSGSNALSPSGSASRPSRWSRRGENYIVLVESHKKRRTENEGGGVLEDGKTPLEGIRL